MIDLHAHLLPGLDDGPDDLAGSLELARVAVAAGTRTLVATPHVDDIYAVDPAVIRPASQELAGQLDQAGIPLRVLPGGEITPERTSQLDDAELASLGLGGSRWLLLECPFTGPAELEPQVLELRSRGFEVLLAHPERSAGLRLDPGQLVRLIEAGARTSITASALTGSFGRQVRSFALTLLERGMVHNVASDAHDAHVRGPGVEDGLEAAARVLSGMERQRSYLVERMPAALLADRALPSPPRPPSPRRGWRRLLRS